MNTFFPTKTFFTNRPDKHKQTPRSPLNTTNYLLTALFWLLLNPLTSVAQPDTSNQPDYTWKNTTTEPGVREGVWTDTARTYVQINSFDLGDKIVEADDGLWYYYFRQDDYLGEETANDTLFTSPRYFKDGAITQLLKEGRVRIIEKSSGASLTEYNHRLVQWGSMCDREFEFPDGTLFWRQLEITGIYGAIRFASPEEIADRPKPVQTKDFPEELEEFPNPGLNRSFAIKDYFPLNPGHVFAYQIVGNPYGYHDTTVCAKSSTRKGEVYYFEETTYSPHNASMISSEMFGEGAYYYRGDSLFTREVTWKKELEESGNWSDRMLVPATMAIGDKATCTDSIWKKTIEITYIDHVSMTTEGGITYPDCVKLKILTYWPETIYLSYVWLQKDIGLVKWVRSTNRTDVLVYHQAGDKR